MSKKIINATKAVAKQSGAMGRITPVLSLTSEATSLISAWGDYQRIRESEETNRASIAANRDITLTAIREQSAALRYSIKKTFQERSKNFDKFFEILEQGLSSEDQRAVDAALSLIVTQIKENPMKAAVQMMQDIKNPNVKEIDI